MYRMVVKYNALEDFLEMNKRSILSIGFHDVEITGSSRLDTKFPELSSSMLCEMLKVSQSAPCPAADCGCLPSWKEGWRLLLNDDYLQRLEI